MSTDTIVAAASDCGTADRVMPAADCVATATDCVAPTADRVAPAATAVAGAATGGARSHHQGRGTGELETGDVDLDALLSALGDEPVFGNQSAFAQGRSRDHVFGGAGGSGSIAHGYRYADEDDYGFDEDPVYGSGAARDLAGSVDDIIDDIANLRGAVSTLLVEQKALLVEQKAQLVEQKAMAVEQKALRAELINGLARINVQLAALLGSKPA